MIVLPPCISSLAAFADRKESGARWAVTGIHLEHVGDKFIAAATDTKVLCVVEGKAVLDDKAGYPNTPTLMAVKEDPKVTTALIPAKFWADSFTQAGKIKGGPDTLRNVAVKFGSTDATFYATNLEKEMIQKSKYVEGRFPPWRDILPKTQPVMTVEFDPVYLANALAAVGKMQDAGEKRCTLQLWSSSKPMLITLEQGEAARPDLKVTALVMPLAGGKEDAPVNVVNEKLQLAEAEILEHKAEITVLKESHERYIEAIKELERDLAIAKGLAAHVSSELEAADHPPTGTEELVASDPEEDGDSDSDLEDLDRTPVEAINLDEETVVDEPVEEPAAQAGTTLDDAFAAFAATL